MRAFQLDGYEAVVFVERIPNAVESPDEPTYSGDEEWVYRVVGVEGEQILVFDPEKERVVPARTVTWERQHKHQSSGMPEGFYRTVAWRFRVKLRPIG